MVLGERLRELREKKNFSQGEIEKRSGLLRCYISRVENGYTVPAVETLEKPPEVPNHAKLRATGKLEWGSTGKDARTLHKFRQLLGKTKEEDRKLLLTIAQKMARKNGK
jgi:transcriptional regulator with XRE-family HTH domain